MREAWAWDGRVRALRRRVRIVIVVGGGVVWWCSVVVVVGWWMFDLYDRVDWNGPSRYSM